MAADNVFDLRSVTESGDLIQRVGSTLAGISPAELVDLPEFVQAIGDLSSAVVSVNGQDGAVVLGASDIGITDSGENFAATDVEGALAELAGAVGGGGVDTSGTPQAGEFARFTDADTIEGRSAAEVLTDLAVAASTLTPSEGVATIDGDSHHGAWLVCTIDAALEIATDNLFDGFECNVQIVEDDSSEQDLTWPAGWVWLGSTPATLAADAVGVVAIRCNGSADANVVAAWGVSE